MSVTVQEELEKAAGLKKNRGESADDFKLRVLEAVNELPDADWKKLSTEAATWFNEATDCLNDKAPLPDYPEAEAPPEQTSRRTRRADPEPEPEPAGMTIAVGDEMHVVTHRDKEVEGTVVDIGDDFIVLKDSEGNEHDFDRGRLKSYEVLSGGDAEQDGADMDAQGNIIEVGDTVTIVTTRGSEFTGELTQLDDSEIAILINGEECFYQRKRLESMELVEKGGDADGDDAGGEEVVPEVGDTVKAVTKRGREVEGPIVEIVEDGAILVVDVNGVDVDVDMDTAQELEIIKAESKPSRSRSSRVAAEPAEKSAPSRSARSSSSSGSSTARAGKGKVKLEDNGGVSVTIRMRQIICEDPSIKVEAVAKQLAKEKLEYKEATLKMIYKDTQKVIEFLKEAGHYK